MADFKKILIADHSPLYRNGMKIALAADQSKLALYEAVDSSAVLAKIEQQPSLDLIILDAALLKPGLDCPLKHLISSILTPVLLLCNQVTPNILNKVCSLGVENIASKTDTLSDLNLAIQKVLAGGRSWPKLDSVTKFNQTSISDTHAIQARISDLTSRQKTVLNYLSHGMMNKQIGCQMGIGENTVKCHVANIFRTLQVSNRTQLVIGLQSHPVARINGGLSV